MGIRVAAAAQQYPPGYALPLDAQLTMEIPAEKNTEFCHNFCELCAEAGQGNG